MIHSFLGNPGGYPESGLVFDTAGNLYGTTFDAKGAVFEMSPQSGGTWKYRILHRFQNRRREDGSGPLTALAFDANGNLYGTTYAGGILHCGLGQNGCGTVFKLLPPPRVENGFIARFTNSRAEAMENARLAALLSMVQATSMARLTFEAAGQC